MTRRLPVIHDITEHDAGPYRLERLDLEFSNGERRHYERLHGRGHGAVAVVPMLDDDTVLLVREYAAGLHRYELGLVKGRIDAGETPREAALRELVEEIGTGAAEVVAETEGWLRYDLPPHLIGKVWKGKYRGQEQKWILARFTGTDGDIDLVTDHPEFDAWQWMAPEEISGKIVPFKRAVYDSVFDAFREHLAKG